MNLKRSRIEDPGHRWIRWILILLLWWGPPAIAQPLPWTPPMDLPAYSLELDRLHIALSTTTAALDTVTAGSLRAIDLWKYEALDCQEKRAQQTATLAAERDQARAQVDITAVPLTWVLVITGAAMIASAGFTAYLLSR